MRVIDGTLMLVFGGVYGNVQALRALLAAHPAAAMVCTGDLAAYCADGAAVCQIMRQQTNLTIIRGNCERTIAAGSDSCECGFAPGTVCEQLSVAWHRHAQNTISATHKAWLQTLPAQQIIQFGGRRLAVIHADAATDNRFIFASTPATDKRESLNALAVNGVIGGHSGIPFTQKIDDNMWHNSGALGMPANDGTPRVWYSLWTAQSGGIEITHRTLTYDVSGAQKSMSEAGLPPEYRLSLQSGIWPSDSVLPMSERRQQGIALNPPPCFWPN